MPIINMFFTPQMSEPTPFYESYKPLPVTSRRRVVAFRKQLLKLTAVPNAQLVVPSRQIIKIQFSTPVLRSQEGRRIGRMTVLGGMKTSKVPGKPKQSARKETKETEEGKEIRRVTISKKKLQRSAARTGHSFSCSDEKIRLSSSPISPLKSYAQATRTDLLANTKLKNKMRRAVKYLVDVATKRKTALRGNNGPTETATARKENSSETVAATPKITIYSEEGKCLTERQHRKSSINSELNDSPKAKAESCLLPSRNGRLKKEKKRRNTEAVEASQEFLINALEEILLEPIHMKP